MPSCAIKWCGKQSNTSNYIKDGITFHKFPQEPQLKEKWIDSTKRDNFFSNKYSVICSRHFTPECFQYLKNQRRLYHGSIPTQYLPSLICNDNSIKALKEIQSHSSTQNIKNNTLTFKESLTNLSHPSSSVSMETESATCTDKKCDDNILWMDLTPRKKKMKRQIDDLIFKLKQKKKEVKRLQDSKRSLKKKVSSLEEVLDTLTKKSLLSQENEDILKSIGVETQELLKRQQHKILTGHIPKSKYSPELRAFAITLHYYSPKAYDFVRKTFQTCLPCVSTIRKWYQTVDGKPGFTQEALNALKKVSAHETQIYATIVFDEMAIKSGIEYHPQAKRYYGHVNFGASLETDCQLIAKEALVFLLVSLNSSFKIPFGYFLINGISSDQKASLLTQAIHLIEEVGIQVVAVTFDGCPANLSMAKKLGCSLKANNLNTTFTNPHNTDRRVAIFLDPCHMIKLIRNAFEHYETFSSSDNKIISWQHLLKLHNVQAQEGFYLANRLRATHIYFKCKVMKVSLATQLFSKGVADSLLFCKNQLALPGFEDTNGTSNFLNMINDLFDILDSHVHGYELKKAVHKNNADFIIKKMQEIKQKLLEITTQSIKSNSKEPIKLIDSPRYTGFLGFCICIDSAIYLIKQLILNENCSIKYLAFHRISQDHIEHFFGNVRCHGGSGNNPTARLFESIYKKLLTYAQIKNSESGNCSAINEISILNCTSTPAIDRINITTRRDDDENEQANNQDNGPDLEYEEQFLFSEFSSKVVEYIAGFIVHSLSKKIKCETCVKALHGDPNNKSLQFIKDVKGKLRYASTTVIDLCRRCEMYIKRALSECDGGNLNSKFNSNYFLTIVFKSFIGYDLFPEINFHQFDTDSTNHLIDLANCVAKKYIDTRLTFITKNKKNPKEYIRKIYNKLIHFKNQ